MARLYPTERIAALNDGVAAVAITLLVLDIEMPEKAHGTEDALLHGLLELMPRLEIWLASFLACAMLWVLHSALLSAQERVRLPSVLAALVHMAAVSLVPFSVTLIADYENHPVSLVWFWANIEVAVLGCFGGVVALIGLPAELRGWAYGNPERLRKTLYALGLALLVPLLCGALTFVHPRLSLWGWLPGAFLVWALLPPGRPEEAVFAAKPEA